MTLPRCALPLSPSPYSLGRYPADNAVALRTRFGVSCCNDTIENEGRGRENKMETGKGLESRNNARNSWGPRARGMAKSPISSRIVWTRPREIRTDVCSHLPLCVLVSESFRAYASRQIIKLAAKLYRYVSR